MKKISMGPKPQANFLPSTADDWVTGKSAADAASSTRQAVNSSQEAMAASQDLLEAAEESVQLKRLTLDIPEELHARIKSQCALRRVKMVDAIRQILDEAFVV